MLIVNATQRLDTLSLGTAFQLGGVAYIHSGDFTGVRLDNGLVVTFSGAQQVEPRTATVTLS